MENSTERLRLFIMTIGFMMLLTLFLSLILAQIHKRFFVADDKRIAYVEKLLPHTNCGVREIVLTMTEWRLVKLLHK